MIQKKQYDTRRPKEKEMIFGIRAVIEAIEAGKVLDKVLLRRDMSSALGKELLQKLACSMRQVQSESAACILRSRSKWIAP